jgi:hypothetical protein
VDEENVVDIPSGVLCSHKKNEIMSFAGKCMDLEFISLREINKIQKDRCHMFSLTCGT